MTSLPGIALPIVLAPMGGAGTVALAAAVSNAGGLGFLACAYWSGAEIRTRVSELRTLTDRPFGLNLFVEPARSDVAPARSHAEQTLRAHERLRAIRAELGIPHPSEPAGPGTDYADQVEAVIAAAPAFFSFTFGIPDGPTLARLRAAGTYVVGTATTVEEAVAIEAAGADAVCAQGAEAGAHRGTFLGPPLESLVGTIALVPQVVDAVGVPVIATGGIGDGRGVAAALALGATAAQLGSAFLLADEAATPEPYRRALCGPERHRTVLTTAFSGRTARGLSNRFTAEIGEDDVATYPAQNAITRDVRTAAARQGRPEFLSLWAGQAVALARPLPAAEIVRELMVRAERTGR